MGLGSVNVGWLIENIRVGELGFWENSTNDGKVARWAWKQALWGQRSELEDSRAVGHIHSL